MSISQTDPQSRAEATRARIEETAERLFRELGYQKTTVADIARDLGMSSANVYRFFPSKSAINEAIASRMLGAMAAEIDAIAAGPGSAADRLRRLFSAIFEQKLAAFFGEKRMHDMVTAAMEEHWGVIETHLGKIHAAIQRVIESGIARGEFAAANPAEAAECAMNTMVAWNHPAIVETCLLHRGETPEQLRAQVASMAEFVLRALRP